MITNTSIDSINSTIASLFDFIINDPEVFKDYQDYSQSIVNRQLSPAEVQLLAMSYILERKLPNGQNIPDVFAERYQNTTDEEKEISQKLLKSINSTFEITRVTKLGFQLNNLLNEKMYNVVSLRKMHHFRGIVPGQFLIGRILEHNNENYLIEINTILPSNAKQEVYRSVLMQQLQKPELMYNDNEEKLGEIEKVVSQLGEKFKEFFKTDEILLP